MTEAAARIAADEQTPAYVYDLDEVRRAWSLLHEALPRPAQLLYSLKANPHPAIVRTLARLGCSAEVCSPGELATALEAGLSPDRVLYTGPGKRDIDVGTAVRAGVRWFSVDSLTGLRQVRRAAADADPPRCLLRVNDRAAIPGQGLAMTGVASQFGVDASQVEAEPEAYRAGIAGFHLYLGTNLSDEMTLIAQFEAAIATARRLTEALSIEPELLNLGGGFGAPFARGKSPPRCWTKASPAGAPDDPGSPSSPGDTCRVPAARCSPGCWT